MMESWRSYFHSILVCVFVCGLLSQLISDTRGKNALRLLSGVVLAITVLIPFTKISLKGYLQIPDLEFESSDLYIMEGQRTAEETLKRYIKDNCEAYILDRARSFDAEILVQISLNHAMVPFFAEIQYYGDPKVQVELENVIATDLGITKENQKWIWNQGNNSS